MRKIFHRAISALREKMKEVLRIFMDINNQLTQEFKLKPEHTNNIISLLDEGNTIPFIARYRKEMTGAIDDQVL